MIDRWINIENIQYYKFFTQNNLNNWKWKGRVSPSTCHSSRNSYKKFRWNHRPDDGSSQFLRNIYRSISTRLHRATSQKTVILRTREISPNWRNLEKTNIRGAIQQTVNVAYVLWIPTSTLPATVTARVKSGRSHNCRIVTTINFEI